MSPLPDQLSFPAEPTQRFSHRVTSLGHPDISGQHEAPLPEIASMLALPLYAPGSQRPKVVAGRGMEPRGSPLQQAALDDPLRRLARALGRNTARRRLARGTSIIEIALLLTLVAAAATLLAWSRQWH